MNKMFRKIALFVSSLFLVVGCNYKEVSTIRCYGDGYKLKHTYRTIKREKMWIQLSSDNIHIGLATYRIGGSIGTLYVDVIYKCDEKAKKIEQSVLYDSISYFESTDIIGKDTIWTAWDSDGDVRYTFKMPSPGDSIKYKRTIDLSIYRYLETDK